MECIPSIPCRPWWKLLVGLCYGVCAVWCEVLIMTTICFHYFSQLHPAPWHNLSPHHRAEEVEGRPRRTGQIATILGHMPCLNLLMPLKDYSHPEKQKRYDITMKIHTQKCRGISFEGTGLQQLADTTWAQCLHWGHNVTPCYSWY